MRHDDPWLGIEHKRPADHNHDMSCSHCSLNCLKGGYIGVYYRGYEGAILVILYWEY